MITFGWAHSRVTAPDGTTYVDVMSELRDTNGGTFTFRSDGETFAFPVDDAWSHGQKGTGITIAGDVWYVKKTGGGCGGCGS